MHLEENHVLCVVKKTEDGKYGTTFFNRETNERFDSEKLMDSSEECLKCLTDAGFVKAYLPNIRFTSHAGETITEIDGGSLQFTT